MPNTARPHRALRTDIPRRRRSQTLFLHGLLMALKAGPSAVEGTSRTTGEAMSVLGVGSSGSSAALAALAAGGNDRVAVAMLRKSLDTASSSVAPLLASMPTPTAFPPPSLFGCPLVPS